GIDLPPPVPFLGDGWTIGSLRSRGVGHSLATGTNGSCSGAITDAVAALAGSRFRSYVQADRTLSAACGRRERRRRMRCGYWRTYPRRLLPGRRRSAPVLARNPPRPLPRIPRLRKTLSDDEVSRNVRVAVHEAGHSVISRVVGLPSGEATIKDGA